jgi:hypothetical protein
MAGSWPADIQVNDRETLERVLADISFRNTSLDFRWRFEVADCNDPARPGWFVNVAFERPDTDTGLVGTGRGRAEFVAKGAWESGVVKTGWLLVELVVRHELMEAFRYRGKRIFNPHNSVHALASIQG